MAAPCPTDRKLVNLNHKEVMILKFKGYLVFDQPVYIALATTQVLYNL